MGGAYPEIARAEGTIREVVRTEEERFAVTLDRGLALLAAEVERARAGGQHRAARRRSPSSSPTPSASRST